jgi:hypothetical protein
MKTVHIGALACFAVALVCYALTWAPGLIGFGFVGVLFELAGWVKLFSREGRSSSDG